MELNIWPIFWQSLMYLGLHLVLFKGLKFIAGPASFGSLSEGFLRNNVHEKRKRLMQALREGVLGELPHYKFYTDLVLKVHHYSRKYGASKQNTLKEIREALVKDDQFEQKAQRDLKKFGFQALLISMITWFFIIGSHLLLPSIQLPKTLFGIIALSHILGGTFLLWGYRSGKRRTFFPFPPLLQALYTFPALIEVGLPLSISLQQAQMGAIFGINNGRGVREGKKNKYEIILRYKLRPLLINLQKKGSFNRGDFSELTQEIWFWMDEAYGKFLGYFQIYQFLIIVAFFLTSYFLYLFAFFSYGLDTEVFPSTF